MSVDTEIFQFSCVAAGFSFVVNLILSLRTVKKHKNVKGLVIVQYTCILLIGLSPFALSTSTPYREDGNSVLICMVLFLVISQACNTSYLIALTDKRKPPDNPVQCAPAEETDGS